MSQPLGPGPEGTISFVVPTRPVSVQARRDEKNTVTEAVRRITAAYDFVLTGDVAVDIAWYVSETTRYETDASADVDNILKPTLDALCGPRGILVNDCQIQHLACHWHGGLDTAEHFVVTAQFDPEEWIPKDAILFVIVQDNLCMPIWKGEKPEFLLQLLGIFDLQFTARDSMLSRGASAMTANSMMSLQRPFHRSRVNDFDVISCGELRARLKGYARPSRPL